MPETRYTPDPSVESLLELLRSQLKQITNVYRERNAIACALALAGLAAGGRAGVTTDPHGEDGFRLVVVVMLPTGRVGWHMDERDPARPWQALPEFREPWESFTGEEGTRRLREFLSMQPVQEAREVPGCMVEDFEAPEMQPGHTDLMVSPEAVGDLPDTSAQPSAPAVCRLDRTQPPPGGNYSEGAPAERVAKLARAWAHYEREHDPPGLTVSVWGFGQREADQPWWKPLRGPEDTPARAAAWAWYWRRVALAAALDAYGWYDQRSSGPWPRVLKWMDEQVEEVEKWLAWHTTKGQKVSKNPALPEVFRV